MWEVEYTDEFLTWWDALTPEQQAAIEARVDLLQQQGPALKRPVVAEILSSRHAPQMKELRCAQDGALRVLFVFNPLRMAILLLGGDKTGSWSSWYQAAVPEADDLYEVHLDELRDEGLI